MRAARVSRSSVWGVDMAGAAPHFLVFANEKGGTGKSTTAVHSAVALAAQGRKVAALDLDTRQRTLGRYLDNRAATMRAAAASTCRCRLTRPSIPPSGETSTTAIERLGRGHGRRGDRHARPRRSLRARGDGPRRHAGHADQRQLRRSRPDRRGRCRDLSRCAGRASTPSWSGTAAPSAPRPHGASVDWVVLRNRMQHIEARNMRRVGERARRAVAPGRLPGHSRPAASGSSTASSSPRA